MTCRYAPHAPNCQLAAVERLAEINRTIQEGKSEAQLTPAVLSRFRNDRSVNRKPF